MGGMKEGEGSTGSGVPGAEPASWCACRQGRSERSQPSGEGEAAFPLHRAWQETTKDSVRVDTDGTLKAAPPSLKRVLYSVLFSR